METDDYNCTGSNDSACKRIGGKLSKKSYKETCKFTINSLLSKPDRPHKTPAPHLNGNNKKAHTVFSFNDSPEKLLKIKSPHMLTAEVKKLYSPPSAETYRFSTSGSKEALSTKEKKYRASCSGNIYRPTTAQLLYQRQLSKQEHHVFNRQDKTECKFDSDNDPFRFTTKTNGHSPPYILKIEKHSVCNDVDMYSPYNCPTSSCSTSPSHSPPDIKQEPHISPDIKQEPHISPPIDTILKEISILKQHKLKQTPNSSLFINGDHKDTTFGPISDVTPSDIEVQAHLTDRPSQLDCQQHLPISCNQEITEQSSTEQVLEKYQPPINEPLANNKVLEKQIVKEEPQPSSKLLHGKLSFFKKAISQEMETQQEGLRAQEELRTPEPQQALAKHLIKELPTNVVRKVMKRSSSSKLHHPVHKLPSPHVTVMQAKNCEQSKVNSTVIKIEKQHLASISNQSSAKHTSLYKTGTCLNEPFGDPKSFNSEFLKLQNLQKKKVSSEKSEVHKACKANKHRVEKTIPQKPNKATHQTKPIDTTSQSPKNKASQSPKDSFLSNNLSSPAIMNIGNPNILESKKELTQQFSNAAQNILLKKEDANKTQTLHKTDVKHMSVKSPTKSTKELKSDDLIGPLQNETKISDSMLLSQSSKLDYNSGTLDKIHSKTDEAQRLCKSDRKRKRLKSKDSVKKPKLENIHEVSQKIKQLAENNDSKSEVKQEPQKNSTIPTVVKTVGIPTPPLSSHITDPKSFVKVEECPDGHATYIRLDMDEFNTLNFDQQNLIVDYFFELTFGETDGLADHVMGIISNGSKFLPNILEYMVETTPSLNVKHQILGKKDTLTCQLKDYWDKIQSNHSRCTFHEGGLTHISLVGAKNEESGGVYSELIDIMDSNPFYQATLPWGNLSHYEGLDPTISNDGPIFWVRPGEQFLKSTKGSRNHKGYRLLKNRETLVPDRTYPHMDHSWEEGNTICSTAAAAFLQSIPFSDTHTYDNDHALKDVLAFDANNCYQLIEDLQLDVYEPPMTQCDTWIEDAKLNQLRDDNVKYARIRLKSNDMYFIPRNVVHQFKTVAACLSVAWHVRLKHYYNF